MSKLFALTLFIVVVTAGPVIDTENSMNKLGNTLNMVYLGTVDGKSFFVDETTRMNWTDAQQLCNKSEMTLASITSQRQVDLLNLASASGKLYFAWINARDALNKCQFVYDHDNSMLDSSLFMLTHWPKLTYCVYVYPQNYSTMSIHAYPCNGTAFVLCEVNHG